MARSSHPSSPRVCRPADRPYLKDQPSAGVTQTSPHRHDDQSPAFASWSATPVTDWFHKYVVPSVFQDDPYGHGDTGEKYYDYQGGAGWGYADDEGITKASNRTWSQWRGYGQVVETSGDSDGPRSKKSTLYMRGLNGEKELDGNRPRREGHRLHRYRDRRLPPVRRLRPRDHRLRSPTDRTVVASTFPATERTQSGGQGPYRTNRWLRSMLARTVRPDGRRGNAHLVTGPQESEGGVSGARDRA
jgi:hypothetical protein